jgi:hypothetical protein
MEIIKEALMHWGEAIQLIMENRALSYSPVLGHWRVKKWAGKNAKSFLYNGNNFVAAFESLLGPHATEHPLHPTGRDAAAESEVDKPAPPAPAIDTTLAHSRRRFT